MKHSDALKLAELAVETVENAPGITKQDMDRRRGISHLSFRERLKAKVLAALWDEFGRFEDQPRE